MKLALIEPLRLLRFPDRMTQQLGHFFLNANNDVGFL